MSKFWINPESVRGGRARTIRFRHPDPKVLDGLDFKLHLLPNASAEQKAMFNYLLKVLPKLGWKLSHRDHWYPSLSDQGPRSCMAHRFYVEVPFHDKVEEERGGLGLYQRPGEETLKVIYS